MRDFNKSANRSGKQGSVGVGSSGQSEAAHPMHGYDTALVQLLLPMVVAKQAGSAVAKGANDATRILAGWARALKGQARSLAMSPWNHLSESVRAKNEGNVARLLGQETIDRLNALHAAAPAPAPMRLPKYPPGDKRNAAGGSP